jgi:hypothetical protein
MKLRIATFLAWLLTAWPAVPRSVEVLEVHPSSQKPLITVLKDGAPQQSATLTVFANNGKQRLTLTTDSRGMAKLPHLHSGIYRIAASTSPTLRVDLYLQIAAVHQQKPSEFTMELRVQPPPPPTFEGKLEAAEKTPIEVFTRAFSGTVRDPSGAFISRASIAVYRHRAGNTAHPLKTMTDHQGRFYSDLAGGSYTAVIQSPGFETRILTFEISSDAAQKELNVKLDVGAITEDVPIAEGNSSH